MTLQTVQHRHIEACLRKNRETRNHNKNLDDPRLQRPYLSGLLVWQRGRHAWSGVDVVLYPSALGAAQRMVVIVFHCNTTIQSHREKVESNPTSLVVAGQNLR